MGIAGLRGARLLPSRVFLAGALASVALFAVLVWLGTRWPWLGIDWRVPASGPGLQVESVAAAGPAGGRLHPGDVVLAVEGSRGERVALDAVMVARATYLLPSYAALDGFVADHRTLHGALRAGPVTLRLADGHAVTVQAAPLRPLRALPLDFWAAALLALLVLLMAFGIFAFVPRQTASRLFLVAGLGTAGTQATIALILGRELAFDASWADPLWAINGISRLTAHWGLLMIFWIYPRPFRPWRASWPIAALFVLAWLATVLRWWPRPNVAAPLIATVTVLIAVPALATWQWRASAANPLDRAVVKVMVLSFALPAFVIVGLNQLPNMLWRRPVIESAALLAALSVLPYVGCAIGIARYRLFDLGRWWFEGLVWGAGGALVVALDALLLWANARTGVALGVALLVAGWLYFPLRQGLWRRLGGGAELALERHLPQLVDDLFGARSGGELRAGWQHLLVQVFAPLQWRAVDAALMAPRLAADGLALMVPTLDPGQSIELRHARKGQRLFGRADVELATELLALTRRAADARRALAAQAAERDARQREKELILQDLHDGLGGLATNIRLLAAVGQKNAPPAVQGTLGTIADLAEESLSEIRGFMYSLDDTESDWPAFAADLRAFGRKLVEPHGLVFAFDAVLEPGALPPDSLLRLNLSRICKEALTNAVKHARASRVELALEVGADRLALRLRDDGIGIAPALAAGDAAPGRSRGLGNLRRRAAQLDATLAIDGSAGTTLALTLRLAPKSPAPGIAATGAAA